MSENTRQREIYLVYLVNPV